MLQKVVDILEASRQLCSRTVTYALSVTAMLIGIPKQVIKAFLGKLSELFDKLSVGMMAACNVQDRMHQLEKENLEKQIQALSQETQALKKNGDVRDRMHQVEKEKLEKQIQAVSEENHALKKLVQETEGALKVEHWILRVQQILIRFFLRFVGMARRC